MPPVSEKPVLPAKVYLRRAEVEKAVGGARQLNALLATAKLRGVTLPGYKQLHFVRADVQAVLDAMWSA